MGKDFTGLGRSLEMITRSLDHQRVKTIQLNQVQKCLHGGVFHPRVKPHIRPSVLVHISIIPVPLGKVGRLHQKTVVIPLEISVFSGINVKHMVLLPAAQVNRKAAAHDVVKIGLAAIKIISR